MIIEVDADNFGQYATLSRSGANSSGDVINLYNADGTRDNSFGGDGSVNLRDLTGLDPGNDFIISDIEFLFDGSLSLTGRNFNFGGVSLPYVLKLRPNGNIDTSFTNGFLSGTSLGIADNDSGNFEAVVDGTGAATLIGNTPNSRNEFVLVRLDDNGNVNSNWGNNGTLTINANSGGSNPDASMIGAEVLRDGSIFVGMFRASDGNFASTLIVKIDPDGFLDCSYGNGGIATVTPQQEFSGFFKFRVDSQGRAVLASSQELARIDFNGNSDDAFNRGRGRINYSDGRFVQDFWSVSTVLIRLSSTIAIGS